MNITAIILAAGQSTRFGADNKLFAAYKGVPLIDHCLNLVASADFQDRILVTGFEHERLEKHIAGLPIKPVRNPHYSRGLGTSLAIGVDRIKTDTDGFMVFLADMPDLTLNIVGQIKTGFKNRNPDQTVVRPTFKGVPGHPVLISSVLKPEIQNLSGDQGAFDIIRKHKSSTLEIDANTPTVIRDIDRPKDLA
ncbi:MAG: nucleotidyltransferase family protein [Acidimicrobiales bacterium]|nr:nucleotidyltransferase family protein [Hyphomonadaceae bacterium]RZV42647.1 MAG: nucleotidyltransferase family protein [Acidimicrobiales bacterium]